MAEDEQPVEQEPAEKVTGRYGPGTLDQYKETYEQY